MVPRIKFKFPGFGVEFDASRFPVPAPNLSERIYLDRNEYVCVDRFWTLKRPPEGDGFGALDSLYLVIILEEK